MQSNISKIAERRANYATLLGDAALECWRLEQQRANLDEQIATIQKKIRLYMGADQEAEVSQKEIDTLQAVADAQEKALEKSAEPTAPVVVDVPPKKTRKTK